MKSSWGNVKVCSDRGGVYVRGWPKKKYTRTHCYPRHTQRFGLLPREAAAYVALRKKGYPINMIAKAFGRSTSVVHRILRRNFERFLHRVDMRKLPHAIRTLSSRKRWITFQKYIQAWTLWAEGEGEEPP